MDQFSVGHGTRNNWYISICVRVCGRGEAKRFHAFLDCFVLLKLDAAELSGCFLFDIMI